MTLTCESADEKYNLGQGSSGLSVKFQTLTWSFHLSSYEMTLTLVCTNFAPPLPQINVNWLVSCRLDTWNQHCKRGWVIGRKISSWPTYSDNRKLIEFVSTNTCVQDCSYAFSMECSQPFIPFCSPVSLSHWALHSVMRFVGEGRDSDRVIDQWFILLN